MAMEKIAGKELAIGMFEVTGCIAQSGSKGAGGELKTYKDENGNDISLYARDKHKTISFRGLIEANAPAKEIGDTIIIDDNTYYVQTWDVDWSNDEVQQVSGTARTYAIASANS